MVSVCGEDWSHNATIGDVNTATLQEIWRGQELFEFRKMLLELRRCDNRACANCFYLKVAPDNIDAYRQQILTQLRPS